MADRTNGIARRALSLLSRTAGVALLGLGLGLVQAGQNPAAAAAAEPTTRSTSPSSSPTTAAAKDIELDDRVHRLSEELRCVVCQNQTLADSQSDLAHDLRVQIREQMAQGRSDAEVRDHLVQRYGNFVLYRPPLKSSTWLLWFGPFLLLAAGLSTFGWRWHRGRELPDKDTGFDESETAPEALPTPKTPRATC